MIGHNLQSIKHHMSETKVDLEPWVKQIIPPKFDIGQYHLNKWNNINQRVSNNKSHIGICSSMS